ncbi:Hypothetical predicted protein [Octopus vulgaris]|uniref:Uncharacterized protein n=1 Tax=Octopus vulgaris TaxID=6645 RepID=A0AA36BHN7_OCTVU|nr:Hypothetical predicted protein [Octopus vulgaris]
MAATAGASAMMAVVMAVMMGAIGVADDNKEEMVEDEEENDEELDEREDKKEDEEEEGSSTRVSAETTSNDYLETTAKIKAAPLFLFVLMDSMLKRSAYVIEYIRLDRIFVLNRDENVRMKKLFFPTTP